MQVPQAIPLQATHLNQRNIEEKEQVHKALEGLIDINSLKDEQIKEVKRLLIQEGLTIDFIVKQYKLLTSSIPKNVRASDVLKALERVERLWGLDDKSEDQITIRALTQSKSSDEITTTLIEITGKTQEYIKKLQERKDE